MAENTVLYEPTDEGITTITIDRPSVRNAVNHATSLQLAEAFQSFENDSTQKVCILTGAGTNFCAGYDLHEVAGSSSAGSSSAGSSALAVGPVDKLNGALGPMGPSRMRLSKPVIAAVSGHAVAGGLELALLADLRVVDATAVFGVFCRRFGVPLIDGGTVRLPRVVGLGRALDMILTGRPVDAQEALAIGLANRLVEDAVDGARELARGLLRFPQRCMRADLAAAQYGAYDAASLEEALRFEFENGAKVVAEESVAGARRFDKGAGRGGAFEKGKL
ncbi:enoyl-CoA hydratase/isomerase family protein [Cordyceps fumosorosea ARSEF 2679]|uniref:Enoyl-CoA hydratase/isomerase family protein n=1 Tax=Cordyceps fumosorosea (strain ARSEF 2679) TaxID=1081104 RepID=A0A167R4Y6_CORFA|nr:enoyl-CoA hydratase/isomerase family protein [Cordyceps fumosorosea ARSEF 2679]OAA58274.1 enoyl-CoA hydratase/isomerase family protein [Cordyceps fumosorosea ARSEF 2679]